MKKSIAILILLVISSTFVIYSYIKTSEAEKTHLELLELKDQTTTLMDDLNRLQERHLDAAAEAIMQKHLTEKALKELHECQSK